MENIVNNGKFVQADLQSSDGQESAQYRRFQYYNRLQNQTGINLNVLVSFPALSVNSDM